MTTNMRGGCSIGLIYGHFERGAVSDRRGKDANKLIARAMCTDDLHGDRSRRDGAVSDSSSDASAPRCNHDTAFVSSERDRGKQGILNRLHDDAREHLCFDGVDNQNIDEVFEF